MTSVVNRPSNRFCFALPTLGHVFRLEVPLEETLLVATGQAARAGCPTPTDRNPSTRLAAELPPKLNSTPIAFARAGGFAVCNGEERIHDRRAGGRPRPGSIT